MYWDSVLKEVLNKKDVNYPCFFTNLEKTKLGQPTDQSTDHSRPRHEDIRIYLGSKYPEIYFTKREAQCMLLLLKGKTMKEAADILSLSARTIEYYIKNMKIKIECRTKSELIGAVIESDFIKFVQMGVAEAETEQNQVA